MVNIVTKRLLVRDYKSEDLEGLHELLSNKVNMYFLDDIASENLDDSKKNLEQAISNTSGHYFCVRDKESDTYIGSVGYDITAETPIGKVVHMGFFILPEHQRKGYTAEAVKAVLSYAFAEDGCIRVTTGCFKDNVPSSKVIEKVGFRKEAEGIKAQYHDGVMKDRLEYAINKDEWGVNK